jgi:hypothetical protein
MTQEATPGVTPVGSQPAPVTPPVTTTPTEQVPSTDPVVIAENLKKGLQDERTRRQKAEDTIAAKDAEIARLTAAAATPGATSAPSAELTAKVELLTLIQKDEFAKTNLGLIEEIMLANPTFDVHRAVDRAKGMVLEALQNGNGGVTPVVPGALPNIPKTITPTATPENPAPKPSGDVLKDVQDGKVAVPPEMREAINRIRK